MLPRTGFYTHTVAEVNLTAFHTNVKMIRSKINENSNLLAVIKTNAYGHGIEPIGEEAVRAGVDRLGVTTIDEGVLLREKGINLPIHLLSSITPEQAEEVVYYQLVASISSEDVVKAVSKASVKQNKMTSVHLKLDTGLHRFGMKPEQVLDFCKRNYFLPNLYWEGIYTHFSSADEGEWATTERQYLLFRETAQKLKEKGFIFPLKHVGASTIAIERNDMHVDMVRPGIALFGYQPDIRQEKLISLEKVLRLRTRIIQIHSLSPHTQIGYSGSYTTKGDEKIAVIPIGHGDGFKRGLSNNGYVLVKGQYARIVGTIALDQTFINVTDLPNIKEGDEVTLIGKQGESEITARDVARWIGSNVDEVLASLMDRVPRKYVYSKGENQ